jgi:deoxyribodipyrimidine photo-lyase
LQSAEIGEGAAGERWSAFRDGPLDVYEEGRDVPAIAGTSQLSADLRWERRCIPGSCWPTCRPACSHDTFAAELAWRDFYADVLYRRPESAWANLDRRMDSMLIDTDDDARRRFTAWSAGRTGFPIIDAGMRQLRATGWMHNRVRMITASFLVKDLHLPWQWGARHFMNHLIDADLASNNHGWQWAAGTGTDAAPYFRIFNRPRRPALRPR